MSKKLPDRQMDRIGGSMQTTMLSIYYNDTDARQGKAGSNPALFNMQTTWCKNLIPMFID